eukprot:gb/GECG01009491.1/.p1 GENE.gb/GECG01009491.1/~~gb/GECG01009491.1/.p1  ORF type:complete len:377 (+),score=63.07 gb/GECG01009491.1/:1-1131(+)
MTEEATPAWVPPQAQEPSVSGPSALFGSFTKNMAKIAPPIKAVAAASSIGSGESSNKRPRVPENSDQPLASQGNKASKADTGRSSTEAVSLHDTVHSSFNATSNTVKSGNDSQGQESQEGNTKETPSSSSGDGEGNADSAGNTRNTEQHDPNTGGNTGEDGNDGDNNDKDDNGSGEESGSEESEEGNVEISLNELNKQLVCPLCNHYFRDAHTVPDCLHTFCKICIVHYCAIINAACPLCEVPIGDPTAIVKPDTVIQGLVDTVLGSDSMQPHVGSYSGTQEESESKAPSASEANGNEGKLKTEPTNTAKVGTMKSLRDYGQKPMQYICMKLEPADKSSPQLSRPFLRTVGKCLLPISRILTYCFDFSASRPVQVP